MCGRHFFFLLAGVWPYDSGQVSYTGVEQIAPEGRLLRRTSRYAGLGKREPGYAFIPGASTA